MNSMKEIFDQTTYNQPPDLQSCGILLTQNENWNDYFVEGVKLQQENNLNLAEQSISRALKVLSTTPKSSDVSKEKAECFHSLAQIYRTRASQQLKKDDFCEMIIKSIALFEAERIYKHATDTENKEINSAISDAEQRLIRELYGGDAVERFNSAGDKRSSNRIKLNEIRSKITNEYFTTLASLPEWGSKDEQERCEAIESIYEAIHDDLKSFIIEMIHYCSEISGPAPCNFSILGLGSTSRKEGTPYSDLEFAILVDLDDEDDDELVLEKRAYFRFLTYFIQAQVLKLGETILPSLGISSLNDFYSENREADWFYDDMIPKGFSFDGMMPWACKTPLGRKTWRGQPPLEFIMTIDEMVELQNVTSSSSRESLETANVFSSVCHLYGKTELTRSYQIKLWAILTDTNRVKTFQKQVLTVMQRLLETYQVENLDSKNYGTQQDVKREVYRLASLLVEQISKFFCIFGRSSWQCIKEMGEKNILTVDGVKNLLATLSITTELRLQCYQKHGRQKEALPTVPQLSVDEQESTPSSSTTTIVRLYQSLLPLKLAISQVLQNQVSSELDPESFMRPVLLQESFIDDTPLTRALAYLRMLQLPKALVFLCSVKDNYAVDDAIKVEILLVLAHCYHMVGRFQKVFECCREVQTLYSMAPESVARKHLLTALILMMDAYMDLGLYQEAVKTHEQIMANSDAPADIKEETICEDLDFLNSSAVLFMKMEQYREAESLLKRIVKKIPNPRKNYSKYFICINNLAVVLLEEDRLTEAKTILENALSIASELYGENAIHPYVACCLTNLSKVHYGLQNTHEANRLLQLALVIYHRIHGQKLIEPSIVDALITKARAYQYAGKWEEMHRPLMDAKEVARILYRDQPHPRVATVLLLLGYCEQIRGKFSVALRHYQECLKIREDHNKEIAGESCHNCETATVLCRIASLGKSCSFESSHLLSLIQKALEIEEHVHGKGTNHRHLAVCFSMLGYHLMEESGGEQGLKYLEKAIHMYQEMKLNDTYSYGYTHLIIGAVLRELSPNKAEEHLKIAKAILKKILKEENHITFLQINSALLEICMKTNRIQEGLELAKIQRNLIQKLSKTSKLSFHAFYQLFRLSAFYEACGRRETAKTLYKDLTGHLEDCVDPTDPDDDFLMLLLWSNQEAMAQIHQSNGMLCEAEAMFQRCAVSTHASTSQRLFVREARLIAQCHLASIFIKTGRDSQAFDIIDDLLKTYERDPEFIESMALVAMSVLQLLGELHLQRFRLNLALKELEKSLKLAEDFRVKARSGIKSVRANQTYGKIMNTIGLVYEKGNDPKRAFECYKCCLDTVQGQQPTMDTATFYQNAADTLKTLGSLDDALTHYKKSLEIRELLHSEDPVREDIATVLYHIALTQYMSGTPKKASETLDKLLMMRRNLLKKGGLAPLQNYCAAIILKGNCHIVQPDEAQKAKDAYEEAEKYLKKMSEGRPNQDYAMVISNIGYACQLLNQWDEAVSKLRQALEMKRIIYQVVKSSPEVALACFLLAEALLKHQKHKEALVYFHEALKIHETLQSTNDVVECLLNIAQCYKCLNELGKAMETFEKVEELCSTCTTLDDRTILRFHGEIADVFSEDEFQDKAKGLWHLQEAETILKRLKETENDEEMLNELQAKILSMQIA